MKSLDPYSTTSSLIQLKMAVKSLQFKKLLVALIFICVAIVVLLYWGVSEEIDQVKPRAAQWNTWTWQCEDDKCVRKIREEEESITPLSTCRMQCGTLPLWPIPFNVSDVAKDSLEFGEVRFELLAEDYVREMLQEAEQVFRQNLRAMLPEDTTGGEVGGELLVVVKVTKPAYLLNLNTDESYTLKLTYRRAEINAETFFGARHALETLSQLVWWDDVSLRVIQRAYIEDAPKFHYRGVLVDTARNFIPIPALLSTVDALAASKLNVFHWHISDSQSFPFDSPRVPQMARYGAYSEDNVYSVNDVEHVVSYARVRGVRVVVEIDGPAHAGNGWQWGERLTLGNLSMCTNQQPWTSYCEEPPCGQLNPDNPKMYEVLGNLYEDIVELTNVTDVFHLGGNEVNMNCWASALNDSKNLMEKWKYFQKNALVKLAEANKGTVPDAVLLWQSQFTKPENLDPKFHVVQTWNSSTRDEVKLLIEKKIRVVISHSEYWFLNSGFGNWKGLGEGNDGTITSWEKVYQYRPWLQLNRAFVLGGEVCLWGEMVDENNLDWKLWPRAAAFAGRIWSDIEPNFGDARRRLIAHRDRLVSRGVKPEAMWPTWCIQNQHMC